MSIKDLVLRNRSCRRFQHHEKIAMELLEKWVDLARLSPSAANLQPLKYILINDEQTCARVFPTLAWAGYLSDWEGPEPQERPSAYIVILVDRAITKRVDCDHGIAAQSILLGATEDGYAGCIIASINRDELRGILQIEDGMDILLVLALGKPAEKIVIETMRDNQDVRYWRDDSGVHHVPKRSLESIIYKRYKSNKYE